MMMTVSADRKHCCAPTLALALAVALLPGFLRPQSADAQQIRRGRPVGARPGVARPGGTTQTTPPPRIGPPSGAGNPGTDLPSGNRSGPAYPPSGGRMQQPINPRAGRTRAVPVPGANPSPNNGNAMPRSLSGTGQEYYFQTHEVYYPNYYLTYAPGVTAPSLYSGYGGAFPPYIGAANLMITPPLTAYVPEPVYDLDGSYQSHGADDSPGQNGYVSAADVTAQNPLLATAISDIENAWAQKDSHPLSNHVRQGADIAVYMSGKYAYSLKGNDYLHITQDALAAISTTTFKIETAQSKAQDVYTVSGRHAFTDREGKIRTVMVSFALEKASDRYYIIQVDTAPDKLAPAGSEGGQSRQPINTASAARQIEPVGIHAYSYEAGALRSPLTGSELDDYFPSHLAYYQLYSAHHRAGVTTYSPFYYYDGALPPFIGDASCSLNQPQTAYVPLPLYSAEHLYLGDHGDDATGQNGNLNVADATARNPLLANAISEIQTAWSQKDVSSLFKHIHRDRLLAVYMSGRFCYSLDGKAYLNMARDAITSGKADRLMLDRVQQKSQDIYTVSGRHDYTDPEGKGHSVLVSYVLEKVDDDFYISQIGTAPQKQAN